MNEVYLIVGVDQEGDAAWDIVRDIVTARKVKAEMDETAFDCAIRIFRVDLTANAGDWFNTMEVQ